MPSADEKRKPWSVLVYAVADDRSCGSSLDAAVKEELRAICDAADFVQLGVAAQVDFKHTPGVFRGSVTAASHPGRRTAPSHVEDHPLWRRILGDVEQSTVRVDSETTERNCASGGVLTDFLQYGQKQCPADRYLVFFYGHASGPMGLFYDGDPATRRATTLRVSELASSLDTVEGLAEIVMFRDCFMNSLETAYQLRRVAQYMIATQAEAPIAGVWPWLNFIATLLPSGSTLDIARAVVTQLAGFLEHPENRGRFADVPYSLIDLGQAQAVTQPLSALATALANTRGDARRRAACARALEGARVGRPNDASNPGDPALLDVATMCENLQRLRDDGVAGPARALGDVVRDRLVRWHRSKKGLHRGISLYYRPSDARTREESYIEAATDAAAAEDAAYYRQLALSAATGWDRIALDPLVG